MREEPKPTDAEFEVVEDPNAHLRDPWWLALPWWKKYRLTWSWEKAIAGGIVAGALAAAAIANRHWQ